MNSLDQVKNMLCDSMLNISKSESMTKSNNEDHINHLEDTNESVSQISSDQEKCIKGKYDCQPKIINFISREQELILELLNEVEDSLL